MPMHSKEAEMQRKKEEAMVAATLQKEKDAADKYKQVNKQRDAAPLPSATKVGIAVTEPSPPSVVFPPSVPNLNFLLTGHVSRDEEKFPTIKPTTNAVSYIKPQAKDTVKSPTKVQQR
jgi:hypothetical protein